MDCSTNLGVQPIIPRLPHGLALVLALSVLLCTFRSSDPAQMQWLPPATWTRHRGCWYKIKDHSLSRRTWIHLLPGLAMRVLVRCAALAGLLHLNGWIHTMPFSGCVLLVPISHSALLLWMLTASRCGASRRARRWATFLLRLYQLTLLALLVGVLYRLVEQVGAARAGLCAACLPFTWRTQSDEETEVTITTVAQDHYQVTLRGTFTLTWKPRDSFERWLLILCLRKLHRVGASRPLLTQEQVGQAFDSHQCEVSRWETLVHQHGWHTLSDRYRHQLRSAIPNPQLSRQILDRWVPAFWLGAWDVRERLIARGIIPDRATLTLESLHALAHHTGFGPVRQILLERYQLQDGQLIARESWWLKELLALNERLLTKLERGERMTPQERVDIEALRLPTPPKQAAAASPPLAVALRQILFASPKDAADEPLCDGCPIRCAYCGSDRTSPKSKKPRLKTVVDPLSGQKRQIEVLRHYCHNPDCTHKTFTHFPPGVLPHSPHPLQARLIAVEVYEVLLSTYRRSARMLDVSAATTYRWVTSLSPAATALAAYLGAVRTSGVVGLDDKWVKVCSPAQVRPHGKRPRAVWRYAYFAVDVYSYDILALELYPQHNDQAVHLLLLELKAKGISPRIVVTDLDPAYGRMLPKVFPNAVHHECIFHAVQNALTQLTRVYGWYYAETNPQAAALHDAVVQLFRAKAQKTVRQRFRDLLALRQDYVAQTPEVACVFDSLERHFPKLVNAFENPLIPTTNNTTELVIRRFDQHYQSMCGLDSFDSARLYLRVFEFLYRLTPFADDDPTRHIRGKCPLELAGYDLDALPIAEFLGQLRLPSLVISGEEGVPMV